MTHVIGSSIESYIPSYLEQRDARLQDDVSKRLEFAEVAGQIGEAPPTHKRLFSHQQQFARLFRLYNKILLVAEPGTGKTISFLTATEYLRKSGVCREVIVLEKGKTVVNDVIKQLFEKVAGATEAFGDSEKAEIRKRSAGAFYKFTTYGKFEKEVLKLKNDKDVIKRFSGCGIVCDEVHNIVYDAENSSRFKAIERVISLARRLSVILVSATPMINRRQEIIPTMNLILPRERRFSRKFDFDAPDAEDVIASKCLNYVSYVKSDLQQAEINFVSNPRAPLEPAVTDPSGTVVVYTSVMGDIQSAVYVTKEPQLPSGVLSDGDGDADGDGLYRDSLQASMFVFPDKSIGGMVSGELVSAISSKDTNGIAKYVRADKGERGLVRYAFKTDAATNKEFAKWKHAAGAKSFPQWLKGVPGDPLRNIARLSGKFASVIRIELENVASDGTSFIYSEAKNGGGAILLGLCLELFGYERFDPTRHEGLPPKALRYALLTPDDSASIQNKITKVFNDKKNLGGEYLKVIIGSRIARDGLNLYNCVRMHLLQPLWTEAGTLQAFMRAVRAVSHDAIFKKRFERLVDSGVTEAEAMKKARVTVDIYRHVAVATAHKRDIKCRSIDKYVVGVSMQKDFLIRRVMRGLKRAAIDCKLNYARNTNFGSGDGSAECDYLPCEYECAGIASPRTNKFETYELMYAKNEVYSETARAIEQAIVARSGIIPKSVKLSDVAPFPEFAARVVERLIDFHTPIRDSLHRKNYVMMCKGGDICLTTNLDAAVASSASREGASPFVAEYTTNPIYFIRRDFKNSVYLMFGKRDFESIASAVDGDLAKSVAECASSAAIVEALEAAYVSVIGGGIFTRAQAFRLVDVVTQTAPSLMGEKRFFTTTIGALADALGKPIDEVPEFTGFKKDTEVSINTCLSEEGRSSAGEYVGTIRSKGALSGFSKAALYLSHSNRVYIPEEGISWRYVTPGNEANAIAAQITKPQTEVSEKKARGGQEAPAGAAAYGGLYGVSGEYGSFKIVNRVLYPKSWGRACSTIPVSTLVAVLFVLKPDVTLDDALTEAREYANAIRDFDIDSITDASLKSNADKVNDDLMRYGAELTPDKFKLAYHLGTVPRAILCSLVKNLLIQKNMMI